MKNIRLPYAKHKNIIFIKKIDYSIRSSYKKITYAYEVYDSNGEMISENIHMEGKPAVIVYRYNKISEIQYWKNGKLHREMGPSILHLDKQHNITHEEWFSNGIRMNEQEVDTLKLMIDRRKKMYRLILKMKNNNLKS